MKKTIKTISFSILILSLGLVLSACNKNQELDNDGEMIHESSQQEQDIENQNNNQSQEVVPEEVQENESEELSNDEEVSSEKDLNITSWRNYENEYFNLKFKYHNNWYFQRDNLNAENYIAVYGFSPSLEELNDKNYAIQLLVLNLEDDFNENFSYFQEKENEDKKYILASNQDKYQNILNLMFDNLQIK